MSHFFIFTKWLLNSLAVKKQQRKKKPTILASFPFRFKEKHRRDHSKVNFARGPAVQSTFSVFLWKTFGIAIIKSHFWQCSTLSL